MTWQTVWILSRRCHSNLSCLNLKAQKFATSLTLGRHSWALLDFFLHKRGLFHFCEGILGKRWIKSKSTHAGWTSFQIVTSLLLRKPRAWQPQASQMRARMRRIFSFFAKATFLTPQQRTNRITFFCTYACMIWILKKYARKIHEQNFWNTTSMYSYILLDVTCMYKLCTSLADVGPVAWLPLRLTQPLMLQRMPAPRSQILRLWAAAWTSLCIGHGRFDERYPGWSIHFNILPGS